MLLLHLVLDSVKVEVAEDPKSCLVRTVRATLTWMVRVEAGILLPLSKGSTWSLVMPETYLMLQTMDLVAELLMLMERELVMESLEPGKLHHMM